MDFNIKFNMFEVYVTQNIPIVELSNNYSNWYLEYTSLLSIYTRYHSRYKFNV